MSEIAESNMEAPEIGVCMLGYGFMGKAHSNAFLKIPHMIYPPPAIPKLIGISGRNKEGVAEAARRYGYEHSYSDWRVMVENEDIQLFDNGGPNDTHAEPCILAAELGKHILCEKPLARTAEEAKRMLDSANKAGIKHMVAFNYRFVPAIRQIRKLLDRGAFGRIYHFRAVYLQEWLLPHYETKKIWKLDKDIAGSGAIGDLGIHIIDLAHYLIGGINRLSAHTKTFIEERDLETGTVIGAVDVDDAFVALVEFDNGALGTLESTRLAAGRKNFNSIEINGEKGSVRFNLERMNELEVYWVDETPQETRGFHNVIITEDYHPWIKNWWPHGHIIGWEHTFVHEITHLLDCIINDKEIAPIGATFEDGYRANVIGDAISKSAASKKQVDIEY